MFESTHIWRNSQSDTRVPCLRKDWHHHQMQKFHTYVIKYTDNMLHGFRTFYNIVTFGKILTSCPKKSDDLSQWQNCPNRLRDIHMIEFISHNHPLSFAQADEELEWTSKLYLGLWNTLTRVKYHHWLAHHIKRWAFQKDHNMTLWWECIGLQLSWIPVRWEFCFLVWRAQQGQDRRSGAGGGTGTN